MTTAPDLTTQYLGLALETPLVASSSPLTGDVASAQRLVAAGAGAIVLPSLFQEQIEHEDLELARLSQFGAESFHEATSYFPELGSYNTGPDGYLKLVERMRAELSVPVIASLNGISTAGWRKYARLIEDAGAHAIELNILYVPVDPALSAADVEARYLELIAAVTAAVRIPVAVKIGAHLTAPAHFAAAARAAGAAGLVLFNRALEPDIDLETLQVVPRLELSRPAEMRMALRWIAILSGRTELSLAATSGVHEGQDALKLLFAGAHCVMIASVLLKRGPQALSEILTSMRTWLTQHEYASVRQLTGSMNHAHCPNPAGYERLNYMRALTSYTATAP